MFHSIPPLLEAIKLEPVNYYLGSKESSYPVSSYGTEMSPEADIVYHPDVNIQIKEEPRFMTPEMKMKDLNFAHLLDAIKLEPVNYYLNSRESNCSSYRTRDAAKLCNQNLNRQLKEEPMYEYNIDDADETKFSPEDGDRKSKAQTCKICNRKLASSSSYYVHMKQHSDSKPHSCAHCDATFCRKAYLEVHLRVHTGEKPYRCSICDKRFTQKSSLNTHKKGHSGLRPYVCQVCLKAFSVKSYLKSHQWTHISDSGVNCTECGLYFTEKPMYFEHMQLHNKRNFECGECFKTFSRESYLIRHINRVHKKADESLIELSDFVDVTCTEHNLSLCES